jgi:putative transposase
MVSSCAVHEVAGWLERADPPNSAGATPILAVVQAVAWHLRVGGSWRARPPDMPPWQTVYGWFRCWQALGLFEHMDASKNLASGAMS